MAWGSTSLFGSSYSPKGIFRANRNYEEFRGPTRSTVAVTSPLSVAKASVLSLTESLGCGVSLILARNNWRELSLKKGSIINLCEYVCDEYIRSEQ